MTTTSEIWNEFSAPLRAFIRRRVRDGHVADDLLQDVFVRVHSKLDSLADNERLTAWLYRIARNVIINHHRHCRFGELDATEIVADQSPDDAEMNRQVGACVGRFIAHLPDDYREAVELDEIQDMPQQAIAERIGLSLSGTKSRIQRGRKLLKTMLLDCCQVEFDRSGNVIEFTAKGNDADHCAEGLTTPGCRDCDDD